MDQTLTVTVSIGLAISIDFPNEDVEEIIHQADMALYAAKSGGRNCVRIAKPGSEEKDEKNVKRQTKTPDTAVLQMA